MGIYIYNNKWCARNKTKFREYINDIMKKKYKRHMSDSRNDRYESSKVKYKVLYCNDQLVKYIMKKKREEKWKRYREIYTKWYVDK